MADLIGPRPSIGRFREIREDAMRLLSNFLLYLSITTLASCDISPPTYDIGDELVVEINPPNFKTIVDNSICEQWLATMERGESSDSLGAITETVIIQEQSVEVSITPIKYNRDGTTKAPAKVTIRTIPPVSKQVSYPAIERPSGTLPGKISAQCRPITRRIISTPATYTIKDETGATIEKFETAEALAAFVDSR